MMSFCSNPMSSANEPPSTWVMRTPAGPDVRDEDALRAAITLHQFVVPVFILGELDTNRSARNLAGFDELVVDLDGRIDGQRETYALVTAAAARDHRVDPDNFAIDVQ